ncbi:hypothetical protein [Mobilicoccus sp.]|uniref:hypothetical protein n=1 Tax=Mobilicoccus sp. TaxID=2034349 RepID=UPI00289EBDD0|nr:hypothetical protein [Mobilicoccus sp.]
MSRFPLNGLARPIATAAFTAALVATSAGLTAPSAAAKPLSSVERFAAEVEAHRDDAVGCRLTETPGSRGLKQWPSAIRSRVAAQFGVTNIGGYRPGYGRSDHHSGQAIDVMIRGESGTRIADWFRANARDLNVKYVIWQQGYWHPGMTDYRPMKDRGSETANHWDHVHVSFHRGSGTCPAL